MGRNQKWIKGKPGDSTRRVARRALAKRLERVWHYLDLAVHAPHVDTENVHQLRVFTRRASAALHLFEPWLPGRRGEWMRRGVKQARKAAGDARDFDVLFARLQDQADETPSSEQQLVLEFLHGKRAEAQPPIEAIYERLVDKKFSRRAEKLVQSLRYRPREPQQSMRFADMASSELARLVAPYLQSARGELTAADQLHAFRIQGKQVRYAMEIFAGVFDEAFRTQLYPLVANLQERLGAINDHVTAERRFVAWHAEATDCQLKAALEARITRERQAYESLKSEFLHWWTTERRDTLRSGFEAFLPPAPSPETDAAANS